MIYVTGDTHGRFDRIEYFCKRYNTTSDDCIIILGDAGINYYGDYRDEKVKNKLSLLPIKMFCIHGNHENRPQNIDGYKSVSFHGGIALCQQEYPNLLFAVDGEIYWFNHQSYLAIGGAYSVDKYYRLDNGLKWFEDEQPSARTKAIIENKLTEREHRIHGILSHTCPAKYIPSEMFLSCIDQSTVDNSTEEWLGSIESKINYNIWYCGHYHTNKSIDKIRFMFDDILELHGGQNV